MRSASNSSKKAQKHGSDRVDHRSPKAEVTGSNPVGCARFFSSL